MTLPRERTYSLVNTREFLYALLNPKLTPRVPKAIRMQARSHLKHFPTDWDIRRAKQKCPEVFGEAEERKVLD